MVQSLLQVRRLRPSGEKNIFTNLPVMAVTDFKLRFFWSPKLKPFTSTTLYTPSFSTHPADMNEIGHGGVRNGVGERRLSMLFRF